MTMAIYALVEHTSQQKQASHY